jgi:hypothetical protein
MPEKKTYSGGCHCGKVRYEVTTELANVIECNCSICSKRAGLLTFVAPDAMKIVSGEGELTDYQFNKHVIHHLFCKTCGVASYATGTGPDGKPMYAINARCLDDVDPSTLSITKYDGKSH